MKLPKAPPWTSSRRSPVRIYFHLPLRLSTTLYYSPLLSTTHYCVLLLTACCLPGTLPREFRVGGARVARRLNGCTRNAPSRTRHALKRCSLPTPDYHGLFATLYLRLATYYLPTWARDARRRSSFFLDRGVRKVCLADGRVPSVERRRKSSSYASRSAYLIHKAYFRLWL